MCAHARKWAEKKLLQYFFVALRLFLLMKVFSVFEMGCKKFAPFVLIGPLFKYSCNWIKRFKRHLYSSELRYLSAMAFETRLLFLNVNQQLIL